MSLPVCVDLLALPGVMGQLLDQSEQWNEMGRGNRDLVTDRHGRLVENLAALHAEDPNRIALIRGFRDENIAHELHFDELPQRPQYDHIHGLVVEASSLIANLAFVVSGENIRWEEAGVAASTEWLWEAVSQQDLAEAE